MKTNLIVYKPTLKKIYNLLFCRYILISFFNTNQEFLIRNYIQSGNQPIKTCNNLFFFYFIFTGKANIKCTHYYLLLNNPVHNCTYDDV